MTDSRVPVKVTGLSGVAQLGADNRGQTTFFAHWVNRGQTMFSAK